MIANYLKSISINAIALNPEVFSDNEKATQWIGKPAATEAEIQDAEKRIGISLPKDIIEFYKTSNGTAELLSHTFSGFIEISKIDWLKKLQPQTIVDYSGISDDLTNNLNNSIVIAGLNHVHQILIIQPYGKNSAWQYWEFASYIPGESPFNGIEQYLERIDDFLIDQVKNKETTI
jgi:hypothetical protein